MTNTHTWTDNVMEAGVAQENPDIVNECLMHLKYSSGGRFQINDLGTKTSSFTLDLNKVNLANITAALTISLPTTDFVDGFENKCIIDFSSTISTPPTFLTTSIIKWKNTNSGKAPMTISNLAGIRNKYIFITIDRGTTWEAEYFTFGGVETAFVQPCLTSNGLIGGPSFAVATLNSSDTAYYGFNGLAPGSSSDFTALGSTDTSCIIYNPNPIKISLMNFTNRNGTAGYIYPITAYMLSGSNDGITYTAIGSYTNSVVASSATWYTEVYSTSFYKYHKITIPTAIGYFSELKITATYIAS